MPHLSLRMAECFSDVALWTSSNRLRLNSDKTETIWFHSSSWCIFTLSIQLSGTIITHRKQSEIWGLPRHIVGDEWSLRSGCCYAKLRVLKEVKPLIPREIFIYLIVQLILTRLDYWNSILVNRLSGYQHLPRSHEHVSEAYLWRKILRPCHSPLTKPALAKNSRWNHIQNFALSL